MDRVTGVQGYSSWFQVTYGILIHEDVNVLPNLALVVQNPFSQTWVQDAKLSKDLLQSTCRHLQGLFTSRVLQESSRQKHTNLGLPLTHRTGGW